MSAVAVITLSEQGTTVGHKIVAGIPDCRLYVHRSAPPLSEAESFDSIADLARALFGFYRKLVYIVPCGVAVRAIAPLLQHKTIDPAVVVVDVGARYAIGLLSGHEGSLSSFTVRAGEG